MPADSSGGLNLQDALKAVIDGLSNRERTGLMRTLLVSLGKESEEPVKSIAVPSKPARQQLKAKQSTLKSRKVSVSHPSLNESEEPSQSGLKPATERPVGMAECGRAAYSRVVYGKAVSHQGNHQQEVCGSDLIASASNLGDAMPGPTITEFNFRGAGAYGAVFAVKTRGEERPRMAWKVFTRPVPLNCVSREFGAMVRSSLLLKMTQLRTRSALLPYAIGPQPSSVCPEMSGKQC